MEKEIHALRQLINFKALGSFYHIFEDKMKIVNSYREDFQKNLQRDDGKEISDLLNAAKLFTENISETIKKINNKKEEILKDKIQNEKDAHTIQRLYSESSSIILKIDDLKNEKSKEEKRMKKLNENKKENIGEIKKESEKVGVYVD